MMYKAMELKTIEEVVDYLQEWISREQPGMPRDDSQDIVGHIIHVYVSDHAEKWQDQYPELRELLDIATEIEITEKVGYRDPDELWQRLKQLVGELGQKVQNQPRANRIRQIRNL